MSNPSNKGWGPGWPVSRLADQVPFKFITGRVHKDIHDLMYLLCEETERRGYRIRPEWSWGYSSRPIGNTTRPSFHSWGLAIDINAPVNPMKNPLTTDMPSWMPEMWESYGFRWGGNYRGTPDAMHYEFMGTPADAREMTKKARKEFDAPVAAKPPPEPIGQGVLENMERLSLSNERSPSGSRDGWKRCQSLLAAAGFPPARTFNSKGEPDGIPGSGTRAALGQFQRRARTGFNSSPATPDFIVGKNTWSALLGIS